MTKLESDDPQHFLTRQPNKSVYKGLSVYNGVNGIDEAPDVSLI